MSNAHGAFSRINRLPAGTGRAKSVNPQILFFYFKINLFGLGKNGYGGGGSVYSSRFFRFGNSLHAVDARFVFHFAVCSRAVYFKNYFLKAADSDAAGLQ